LVWGWALAEQGQAEEGMVQMRQGLAAVRATGAEIDRPRALAVLAKACGQGGQGEEGLSLVAKALAVVDRTGERFDEAELYRLKGELTLAQSRVLCLASSVPSTQHPTPSTQLQSKVQSLKSKVSAPPPPTPD